MPRGREGVRDRLAGAALRALLDLQAAARRGRLAERALLEARAREALQVQQVRAALRDQPADAEPQAQLVQAVELAHEDQQGPLVVEE